MFLKCVMPNTASGKPGEVYYAVAVTLAAGAIGWATDRKRAHKCDAKHQVGLVEFYHANPRPQGFGELFWEDPDDAKRSIPLKPNLKPQLIPTPAPVPTERANVAKPAEANRTPTVPPGTTAPGSKPAPVGNLQPSSV